MLTEDHLMRMINLAIAALVQAIGLRKAGRRQEAQQSVDQALESLLGLPAPLLKQLDEAGLLDRLLNRVADPPVLDLPRLAVVADLFNEEGQIQAGQPAGRLAWARALRLYLELALADLQALDPELAGKIAPLTQALQADDLPVETRLAQLDVYEDLQQRPPEDLARLGQDPAAVAETVSSLRDLLRPYLE